MIKNSFEHYKKADEEINRELESIDDLENLSDEDKERIGNIKNILGEMYERGEGVERDYKIAADYFRAAANDFDNLPARKSLGRKFLDGRGVEKDDEIAFLLFKGYVEDESCNDAEAMKTFAQMYEEGIGVDIDKVKAEYWHNKADEFPQPVDDIDFTNYDVEAFKWADEMLKAPCKTVEDSKKLRAMISNLPDNEQTFKWIVSIIEGVNPNASKRALRFSWPKFRSLIATPNDSYDELKFKYLKSHLKSDYMEFAKAIGDMYYYGRGTEQNWREAVKYYQMSLEDCYRTFDEMGVHAISADDSKALETLGKMYLNGEGVHRDEKKAAELFEASISAAGLTSIMRVLDPKNSYVPKYAILHLIKIYQARIDKMHNLLKIGDINFKSND